MGRETILFKTEEKMSREEAAALLRRVADKLELGSVILQQGEAEPLHLEIGDTVEVEIKAEEESGRQKAKRKLELEIEWIVGDQQSKGGFTLG